MSDNTVPAISWASHRLRRRSRYDGPSRPHVRATMKYYFALKRFVIRPVKRDGVQMVLINDNEKSELHKWRTGTESNSKFTGVVSSTWWTNRSLDTDDCRFDIPDVLYSISVSRAATHGYLNDSHHAANQMFTF